MEKLSQRFIKYDLNGEGTIRLRAGKRAYVIYGIFQERSMRENPTIEAGEWEIKREIGRKTNGAG